MANHAAGWMNFFSFFYPVIFCNRYIVAITYDIFGSMKKLTRARKQSLGAVVVRFFAPFIRLKIFFSSIGNGAGRDYCNSSRVLTFYLSIDYLFFFSLLLFHLFAWLLCWFGQR